MKGVGDWFGIDLDRIANIIFLVAKLAIFHISHFVLITRVLLSSARDCPLCDGVTRRRDGDCSKNDDFARRREGKRKLRKRDSDLFARES